MFELIIPKEMFSRRMTSRHALNVVCLHHHLCHWRVNEWIWILPHTKSNSLYSSARLRHIITGLNEAGMQLPLPGPDSDQLTPSTAMEKLGLEVIQNRETHRQIRKIVQA